MLRLFTLTVQLSISHEGIFLKLWMCCNTWCIALVLLSSCLATGLFQLNMLSSGCIPTLNMLPIRSPYRICNWNTGSVLSLTLWMYHRSMHVARKPSTVSCLPYSYRWALPDQMSQAGFYHQPSSTGDDRAMCFTCNVCLVCWEPTDEPWWGFVESPS